MGTVFWLLGLACLCLSSFPFAKGRADLFITLSVVYTLTGGILQKLDTVTGSIVEKLDTIIKEQKKP